MARKQYVKHLCGQNPRPTCSYSRSPRRALVPFLGEGSPKIDYSKMGSLILTSLLEDLVLVSPIGDLACRRRIAGRAWLRGARRTWSCRAPLL